MRSNLLLSSFLHTCITQLHYCAALWGVYLSKYTTRISGLVSFFYHLIGPSEPWWQLALIDTQGSVTNIDLGYHFAFVSNILVCLAFEWVALLMHNPWDLFGVCGAGSGLAFLLFSVNTCGWVWLCDGIVWLLTVLETIPWALSRMIRVGLQCVCWTWRESQDWRSHAHLLVDIQ